MPSYPVVDERLENGLRVVVCEDHNVPVAALNVWYGVGSRHEPQGKTGFAHLFEHIMFQGSANVGPTEHFSYVQGVGGTLNGTTSFDRTNYYETVPAHALELSLWLEADRMGTLLEALTQENLDNQRDVVKNERRQRYDNVPYGTSWEHLFSMTYPAGHPYHHMPIGSMADLDAASLDDCREFFRTYYAPDNAVVAIVGDVDADEVMALAGKYFGGIPPHGSVPAAPDGTIGVGTDEVRRVLREPVPAEAVYLGFRFPADGTPECDAADLACRVLAEGGSSRLVSRLVRREQLAQVVSLAIVRLVGGTSLGYGVARARTGASLDRLQAVLDEELMRFAEDGPTPDELERAKAQAEREFIDQVTTAGGLADELARYATLFDDATLINGALQRMDAVTAEQVRDVARERFAPSNRAVLEYRADAEEVQAA